MIEWHSSRFWLPPLEEDLGSGNRCSKRIFIWYRGELQFGYLYNYPRKQDEAYWLIQGKGEIEDGSEVIWAYIPLEFLTPPENVRR